MSKFWEMHDHCNANYSPSDIPEPEGLSVTVYDGKYTVIQEPNGGLKALRYGEPWRDCTGDGLILALAQEIQELRDQLPADVGNARETGGNDAA